MHATVVIGPVLTVIRDLWVIMDLDLDSGFRCGSRSGSAYGFGKMQWQKSLWSRCNYLDLGIDAYLGLDLVVDLDLVCGM